MVSVSGGADSDRMVDLIERIGYPAGTVIYCYFDTGMEYKATKDHLFALEQKYGIQIRKIKAVCPVGKAVREYGYPFLSKKISNYIHRLQSHNFCWEDRPFSELYVEYPRCKAALRWWCNEWGDGSKNNINRRKWLKEYMIAYPPKIHFSDACCNKAKKATAYKMELEIHPDLDVQGVRKAEGGIRSQAYSGCFDDIQFGCSRLRPLFWFLADDCRQYDAAFNVTHSACYTVYGLDRTGCACCPFGKHWQRELEVADQYEPNLAKAARIVFGPSYEYTTAYYEFRDKMSKKAEEGE